MSAGGDGGGCFRDGRRARRGVVLVGGTRARLRRGSRVGGTRRRRVAADRRSGGVLGRRPRHGRGRVGVENARCARWGGRARVRGRRVLWRRGGREGQGPREEKGKKHSCKKAMSETQLCCLIIDVGRQKGLLRPEVGRSRAISEGRTRAHLGASRRGRPGVVVGDGRAEDRVGAVDGRLCGKRNARCQREGRARQRAFSRRARREIREGGEGARARGRTGRDGVDLRRVVRRVGSRAMGVPRGHPRDVARALLEAFARGRRERRAFASAPRARGNASAGGEGGRGDVR